MNRRGFFGTVAAAVAGFAILPPATTYTRLWKATQVTGPRWIPNPEYINAPFEVIQIDDTSFGLLKRINPERSGYFVAEREGFPWRYALKDGKLRAVWAGHFE